MKLINADMCLQTMNDFHVFDYDKEKMLQQTLAVSSFMTQNVVQIGDNILSSTTRTHFSVTYSNNLYLGHRCH